MKLGQKLTQRYFDAPTDIPPGDPNNVPGTPGEVDQNDPASILDRTPVEDQGKGTTSQGEAPNNSDNPNPEDSTIPEKYAGKSPEELIQLLEGNDQKIQELFGKASKAEELEEMLLGIMQNGLPPGMQQQAPQPGNGEPETPAPMFTEEEAMEIFKDPQGALQKFADRIMAQATEQAENNITQKQQLTQQHQEIRNNFYQANPELVGAEILVGAVGNAVQQANPNVPYDKLIPVIAKVAKEELTKLRGQQSTVPNVPVVEPHLGNAPRVPATPQPQGEQAEINDLIRSRR